MWGIALPSGRNTAIVKRGDTVLLLFYDRVNLYCYWQTSDIKFYLEQQGKILCNGLQMFQSAFCSEINVLIRGWDRGVGYKIKFKRKGSWMRLRRKWPQAVSLKVGLGHYQRISSADMMAIRFKKYLKRHSVILISWTWLSLQKAARAIYKFRPMNAYTKRGIRHGRQFFYRRQGKQSRYTAMKSKIF